MTEPVFVSFYTSNWHYTALGKKLARDLTAYGHQCHFAALKNTGDWITNTALKATFICDMLGKYEHVVWVDADSHVQGDPVLFRHQSTPLLLRPHSTMPSRRWHVGVMGIMRTPETLALCRAWRAEIARQGGTDEARFDDAYRRYPAEVATLPAEYLVLPDDNVLKPVLVMGLSEDESKLARKGGRPA